MDEAIKICTIAWSNCLRASSAHSFDQIKCKIFLKKAILPRLVWEMETSWCAGGQNRNFWTELMLWKTQTILECADLREGRCSNGNKYTAVKFTVWKQLEENWGKEMSICKSLLSGAFAERKTKQSICFAWFSAEHKQGRFFQLIARQSRDIKLKTLSTSVLFNHFFILCGLLSGKILTVGLKVKATDVWCKNARRFSVFNCSDLTNKTVIFVGKAVPTLLVNYLPTKNEENRPSEPFRTFISRECILTQG